MSTALSHWSGRRVLITGHTGFKGSWLVRLLTRLGARVYGIALAPVGEPNLFEVARIEGLLSSHRVADIRDTNALTQAFDEARPDVVLHLAAQALVRPSYREPIETFDVNFMGTARVLAAAGGVRHRCAVVIITTDKVYENRGDNHPFRESDPLGAADPYSTSKAAAELVAASWRASFRAGDGGASLIATARAGNVIGGGDWSADRLIPDCARAFSAGVAAKVRNPASIRPWQHVLDPLTGYLAVADRLLGSEEPQSESAWNFGPDIDGSDTVEAVVERACTAWGQGATFNATPEPDAPKEAEVLRLDSSRARLELGWRPVWDLDRSVRETFTWYRAYADGEDMAAVTDRQIEAFLAEVSPSSEAA